MAAGGSPPPEEGLRSLRGFSEQSHRAFREPGGWRGFSTPVSTASQQSGVVKIHPGTGLEKVGLRPPLSHSFRLCRTWLLTCQV